MIRSRLLIATFLIVVAAATGGQSLLDDPEYRELVTRASELKEAAQVALDEGRYDEAIAYSRESEAIAEQAESYAEQRVLAFRANGWVNRARQRIRYAESIDAVVHFTEEWDTATRHMADAQSAFDTANWLSAIESARLVIAALEDIRPVRTAGPPRPAPAPASRAAPATRPSAEPRAEPDPRPAQEAPPGGEATLPRYYVVRYIPERRDSFWRIAEYDFVYGNPWLWPELYEANRDKLPDPDNPDWIEPGIVIEIPSIDGEHRTGIWNPDDLP